MVRKGEWFIWISIDGTDGAGKTTISKKLHCHLQKLYPNKKFILFNEFSSFETGKAIKRIIRKEKFFKLNPITHYPLAETFMLAADLMCQFEAEIIGNKNRKQVYIISDRGPYSFLTYQLIRLKNSYPHGKWDKWVENILKPFNSPHLSILLVSDINEIKKRLIKRGDKQVSQNLQFIKRIQNAYIKLAKNDKNSFILKNKKNIPQKTIEDAARIVKQYLLDR